VYRITLSCRTTTEDDVTNQYSCLLFISHLSCVDHPISIPFGEFCCVVVLSLLLYCRMTDLHRENLCPILFLYRTTNVTASGEKQGSKCATRSFVNIHSLDNLMRTSLKSAVSLAAIQNSHTAKTHFHSPHNVHRFQILQSVNSTKAWHAVRSLLALA